MTIHKDCGDFGYQQVTCDRCGKTYVCTPASDFYCCVEGDHSCEPCLLKGMGITKMTVVRTGGLPGGAA